MFSDFAAVHCALVSAAVTVLFSAVVVGALPPFAFSCEGDLLGLPATERGHHLRRDPVRRGTAACALLSPFCEAASWPGS